MPANRPSAVVVPGRESSRRCGAGNGTNSPTAADARRGSSGGDTAMTATTTPAMAIDVARQRRIVEVISRLPGLTSSTVVPGDDASACCIPALAHSR